MLKKTILFVITFIIFFAPLSLGNVHLWSKTVLQISILLAFYLYILWAANSGRPFYFRNMLNIFFLIFVLYAVFQLYSGLTRAPYRTYESLKITLLYWALFITLTNYVRTGIEIDALLFKITTASLLVCLIGIFQLVTSAESILWLRKVEGSFFSVFVNENHFACYASMVALITLGQLTNRLFNGMRISWDMPLRKISLVVLDSIFNGKILFLLFSFSIMAAAVFLSGSRGGMISFLAGLSFFALNIIFRKRKKSAIWLIILGAILAYLLLNWIGIARTTKELYSIFSPLNHIRVALYMDGLSMARGYPYFGTGMGSFANVFPLYRTGPAYLFYPHLHNDILQLFIEAGSVGFFIIAAPLLLFIARLLKTVSRSQNPHIYLVGLGILSAFLCLGLHSIVDFSLRLNAISSLAIILLSLSYLIIRTEDTPS